MSKSSPEFLARLESRSREKQTRFMQNIARRLGRETASAPDPHRFQGAPEYWNEYDLSESDRVRVFMENWRKVGGEAERFATMDEAKEYMAAKAKEMKAKHMLRHDEASLNEMNLEAALSDVEMTVWNAEDRRRMQEKAAGADIGIIKADYAVAHTGSIVTFSAPEKGRIVSLLPTAVMAIIPVQRVKTRLGEVMRDIRAVGKENMPAGIHFISGPSRSADIENDLTIGVHGPGIVYALIVG